MTYVPTDDIDPHLILLWIMERMDGVSIQYIAARERMAHRRVSAILKEWGCPLNNYGRRNDWSEALAVWNTGEFTWDEVAHECRLNMSGKLLRDHVKRYAMNRELFCLEKPQRGFGHVKRRKVDAA